MPTKDKNGIDTYDNSNYKAPVQAVVGMAGFSLDKFSLLVSIVDMFCQKSIEFYSQLVSQRK